MGYQTNFEGMIEISPPLNEQEKEYLKNFSKTRHYQRKSGPYTIELTDDIFFKPIGDDAIDMNKNEPSVPSLYCCWEPSEDGQYLKWNEQTKFYHPKEWLQYIIEHFLEKNAIAKKDNENFSFLKNHTLNGVIEAQGEDNSDHYYIIVENNQVSINTHLKNINKVEKTNKYKL